ncbi:nucleolar transcription factor 1-like isoform 1-T1 [Glossina fuscipes fuscipes]
MRHIKVQKSEKRRLSQQEKHSLPSATLEKPQSNIALKATIIEEVEEEGDKYNLAKLIMDLDDGKALSIQAQKATKTEMMVCDQMFKNGLMLHGQEGCISAPESISKAANVQKRRSVGFTEQPRNDQLEPYSLKRRKINVPGALKMPLTGYVRYMNERRDSLRREHPNKTAIEHTKIIGQEWQAMPAHLKAPYMRAAELDKERISFVRYLKELHTFLESHPDEPARYRMKRNKINVAGALKMPLTGYVRYMNERRDSLRREHPNKTAIEHTKIIGQEWQAMPAHLKAPYMNAAELDRQRYLKELHAFLESHPDEPARYHLKRRKTNAARALKMPLTGYVRYMNERRDSLRRDYPNKTAIEHTKIIGQEWQAMPAHLKAPYMRAAELDKERYLKELHAFLESHPDEPARYRLKGHKINVAGAHKMPLTGYVRYMNERRDSLRREYPNKTAIEHTKIIGQEWQAMSADHKAPYMKAAEIDRQRYFKEMSTFLKSSPDEPEPYRLKRPKANAAGALKMPLNGYVRYMNERRESLRKEYPNKTAIEHTKIIGEEWRTMSADRKAPYMKAAELDRQRYLKELSFLKSRPDVLVSELAQNKPRNPVDGCFFSNITNNIASTTTKLLTNQEIPCQNMDTMCVYMCV